MRQPISLPISPNIYRETLPRYDLSGPALRLVEVVYTGREAKSKDGCPVVQSVSTRSCIRNSLKEISQEILKKLATYPTNLEN